MKQITGDLVKMAKADKFDVIFHGCNCYRTMGAGIAKQIKIAFPDAYKADLATNVGDRTKLGTITFAKCGTVNVVNAYTQHRYGRNQKFVDYDAVRKCCQAIARKCGKDVRIGYPRIGCGLAGGDWNVIEEIINEEFLGLDHTLVTL